MIASLVLVIVFLCNLLCAIQVDYQVVDVTDPLWNSIYARSDGYCYYQFYYTITDSYLRGISSISALPDSPTNTFQLIGQDNSEYLYFIEIRVQAGQANFSLNIVDSTFSPHIVPTTVYECLQYSTLYMSPSVQSSPPYLISNSPAFLDSQGLVSYPLFFNASKGISFSVASLSTGYTCQRVDNLLYSNFALLNANINFQSNSTPLQLQITYQNTSTITLPSYIPGTSTINDVLQTKVLPSENQVWIGARGYMLIEVYKNFTSPFDFSSQLGKIYKVGDNGNTITLLGITQPLNSGNNSLKLYIYDQVTPYQLKRSLMVNSPNPIQQMSVGDSVPFDTFVSPSYTMVSYTLTWKFPQPWLNTVVLPGVNGFTLLSSYVPVPVGIVNGRRYQSSGSYRYMLPYYLNSQSLLFNNISFGVTGNDTTPPVIDYVQYISIGNLSMIIRIKVTDESSGVFRMTLDNNGVYGSIDSSDIAEVLATKVVSTGLVILSAIYEKIVPFKLDLPSPTYPVIRVVAYDNALNRVQYGAGIVNSVQLPLKLYGFPGTISRSKSFVSSDFITFWNFSKNNLNLTNKGADVQLMVQFDPRYTLVNGKVYLSLDLQDPSKTFQGYYDGVLKMFIINFYIPMNPLSGALEYTFFYPELAFRSIDMVNLVGLQRAQLMVSSVRGDRFPPVFTFINTTSNEDTLSWTFTISDSVNGLKSGFIKIQSTEDILPFVFELNITGKNINLDSYTFSIPTPSECSTSTVTFRVVEVELVDRGLVKSTFKYGQSSGITPFMYINNSNSDVIVLSCPDETSDNTPPVISNISLVNTGTVDVGLLNRGISISFSGQDLQSEISERHIPYCKFFTVLQEFYVQSSKFTVNDTAFSGQCSTDLPYGFGWPIGVFRVSVYGVTDIALNVAGLEGSVDYPVVMDTLTPLIESNLPITLSGGSLTLFGKKFGKPSDISMSGVLVEQDGFLKNYTIPFLRSVALSIDGLPAFQYPFNVTFFNSLKRSNTYTVYPVSYLNRTEPTPSPTLPVPSCPGSPPCGGETNGVCLRSGCKCVEPWYGADCLSQIINTSPPDINSTSPNSTINVDVSSQDGESISINTLISILSLNEVASNGTIVTPHVFNTWIFTNLTGNTSSPYSLYYQYLTNVTNNGVRTNITIGLQWYHESDTFEFADKELDMRPSTIKYTITITPYGFTSALNTLQIRLAAQIHTTELNEGSCIYQESSNYTNSIDDSEYVKLQINDHSLYGRFIKRAIIDDKVQRVSSQLLTTLNSSAITNSINSLIAIQIPHYRQNILIDPDFTLLRDFTSAMDKNGSICKVLKDRSLTKAQLAGIIIGVIVFIGAFVLMIVYVIYKNRQDRLLLQALNSIRLNELDNRNNNNDNNNENIINNIDIVENIDNK
ncbi:hypothetical protein DLAC_06062 [Tieghemostelium lacteum]|uniref:EGF-like domain-containing protein n=1 Tax=Tieghemostelium lacteum TaxID=361077 RepID=A0A151ZHB9_TIELA|nr:hypothetical protein DLAC_06062 [Tieghemostelium lacteum]|eukprot:KYQ93381.1 hypothetical protein DLAC_06062 [Tieghemostelium lacteum]